MEVLLKAEHLNAMAHLAGDKDIRPWVNGVWVEAAPQVTLCATTGELLGFFDPDVTADQVFKVQVPRAVLAGMKRWRGLVRLHSDDAVHWTADNFGTSQHWKSEDLVLPDVRRAVPRKVTGAPAHFDFALLDRFQQARKALRVESKDEKVYVVPNGAGAAHVRLLGHPEFFGVVMPMRMKTAECPTHAPDWVFESAVAESVPANCADLV